MGGGEMLLGKSSLEKQKPRKTDLTIRKCSKIHRENISKEQLKSHSNQPARSRQESTITITSPDAVENDVGVCQRRKVPLNGANYAPPFIYTQGHQVRALSG